MENSFYKWKQLWEGVFYIKDLFSDYMYLVAGEEKAALIDTGMGFPGLRQLVERLTDKPVMVLNTMDIWIILVGTMNLIVSIYIQMT